jgi:hypothetical protein
MKHAFYLTLLVALCAGCSGGGGKRTATSTGPLVAVPPPMPRRNIAPPATPPKGHLLRVEHEGDPFMLFIPQGWGPPAPTNIELTVHFHGAAWFAIDEHLRRGLRGPLLTFSPGEGSTIYRRAFENPARFSRLLRHIEGELKRNGASTDSHITAVDISSFSAGYGAVRELVKSPEYRAIIRRIVLCDSLYASFAPGSSTKPAPEHIDPWIPFAKMAAKGEKTFVLTHSLVPTPTYASTAQCATALIEAVGGSRMIVERGSIPATLDPEFPLLTRSDIGHFHVWGYDGADAAAHVTHVRHLADVWKTLDAAGAP